MLELKCNILARCDVLMHVVLLLSKLLMNIIVVVIRDNTLCMYIVFDLLIFFQQCDVERITSLHVRV